MFGSMKHRLKIYVDGLEIEELCGFNDHCIEEGHYSSSLPQWCLTLLYYVPFFVLNQSLSGIKLIYHCHSYSMSRGSKYVHLLTCIIIIIIGGNVKYVDGKAKHMHLKMSYVRFWNYKMIISSCWWWTRNNFNSCDLYTTVFTKALRCKL